jgi:hypothetical protein
MLYTKGIYSDFTKPFTSQILIYKQAQQPNKAIALGYQYNSYLIYESFIRHKTDKNVK